VKIIKLLNITAILALVASAGYAYSIKYETILYAERIKKLKNENKKLEDSILLLRAELAHLTRPERMQHLAQKLDLQQLDLTQVGSIRDLPDRPPRTDSIGRKLEMLGLSEPTNTPASASANPAVRGATPAIRPAAKPANKPAGKPGTQR